MVVLSVDVTHVENDFPILTIEVKNPRTGGLLDGPTWCWVARVVNGIAKPCFFGRIIGQPDDIFDEVLTLKYRARSARWQLLKQIVADSLKKPPYYDQLFTTPERRDDVDAVLEGYSVQWHYDRLPSGSPADLNVSVSDILNPDEGFVVFHEKDGLYDNMKFNLGQQPLTRVRCKADVHWTQKAAGTLDMGAKSVVCWTGGSLIDSWPKAGTQLSGGYLVASARAFNGGAQFGSPIPHNYNYENRAKQHTNGDVMSVSASWTTFPCGGEIFIYGLQQQAGVVNPGTGPGGLFPSVDDGSGVLQTEPTTGNEDAQNIPAHLSYSQIMVCQWQVFTTLILDYDAARPRTERLEFELNSDLQAVYTDPNEPASKDTETVTLPGGDVGSPLFDVKSWYTLFLSGSTVKVGTIVGSTPQYVGGPIFAACVVSGVVGGTEPDWSDVLGDRMTDGSVTWAIIGTSVPTELRTWKDVSSSIVQAGTMIRAQNYLPSPLDTNGVPMPAPPAGTSGYVICTTAGKTQDYSNPAGTGLSETSPGWPEPKFNVTQGATTSDGSVVWTGMGNGTEPDSVIDVPLGLNTAARSFFSTDRGIRALKYCAGYVRAKLLLRSRVAKLSFECSWESAEDLSCRKGVLIYDHRLPGGWMLGKVTSYSLIWNPDAKTFLGRVTIEGSAGFGVESGSTILSGAGTPSYGSLDWDGGSYQVVTDPVLLLSANDSDVGLSIPIDAPNDDGITFPISNKSQVVVRDGFITGRPPGAPAVLPNSTYKLINTYTTQYGTTTIETNVEIPNGFTPVEIPYDTKQGTLKLLVFYPVTQYYLELIPLTRSFTTQYNIKTTPLSVPKMIDLSGASLP